MKIKYGAEARMCTRKRDFRTNEIVLDTLNSHINELKDIINHKQDIISKLVRPFVKLNIPKETFDKILEGKFETKAFVDGNIQDPLMRRLGYVIELDDTALGIRKDDFERWW